MSGHNHTEHRACRPSCPVHPFYIQARDPGCTCGIISVGLEQANLRNFNPLCPVHGLNDGEEFEE